MGRERLTEEELNKFHDGLCPIAIGDGDQCRCLVHWVTALQKEADRYRRALETVQGKMTSIPVPACGEVWGYIEEALKKPNP